jgi:transposase
LASNYEKSIFKQLEETLKKLDFIVEENKQLKIRIEFLEAEHHKEIKKLNNEIINLKAEHQSEVTVLNVKIDKLTNENQKLKDIINKDSSNSSKPPSSNGFKKIHNSREKTNKTVGGQKGHKGNIPILFDKPTEIVEHKKELCECGCHIIYSENYRAKQAVDIEIVTNIVEHRAFDGVCSGCNLKIENKLPNELTNTITYGNTLKSFSAILSSEGMVSINRIKQMLSELTNGTINLSEGTIAKWNKDLANELAPVITQIKKDLLTSPVLHKDETGIRINKTIEWFHVLGNKTKTLYFSHSKRGNVADNEIELLPIYSGTLVHDHLKGLYNYSCNHAECNAHILRYLKSAAENKNRAWASDMIIFLVNVNNSIKALKANERFSLSDAEFQAYSDKYDEILLNGQNEFLNSEKKDYNGEDMKLLRRLKKYKTEHLRFVSDFLVPFDNNQAERDLRMIKAKTKISGCFRGENGGVVFASIKSYTSTLRKNSKNIFESIRLAFEGMPVIC